MFWAISQLHEHTIRAALDQGRFTPYLPGHPEVPTQAQAAAGFTVEGYYADRLSIGVKNDVVIIPVTGTMSRGWGYDNYFSNSFLIRLFASIADNDAKKGVILDFNSGGGTVDSTDEVNAGIAALAQRKPVVSLVSFCASAALWSAAPSNEIMMRPGPTVQIGSIGTMYIHTNYAKALEKQGYEPTIFRSTGSVDKAKPNGIEPLDAKTIADIQAGLDISNRVFKGAVRAGRGSKITSEEIYTGKLYGAKDAIRLGLADSIGNTQAAYQKVISLSKSYV